MSIVVVNSTLAPALLNKNDSDFGPLHFWGYRPRREDVFLTHRLNRVGITLRAKLGGLDPIIFLRTCWHLMRGARGVYLVTQPDLWQALPLLRRMFPQRRFVTWAWMDWEVDRHLSQLRACDHVLCLTEGAKCRLDAAGLEARSSLAIWGGDPGHYRDTRCTPADTDVLVCGRTGRDAALAAEVISLGRYSIKMSRGAAMPAGFRSDLPPRVAMIDLNSENAMVAAYHQCRVSWIPLLAGDRYPSGYTNLVESLLCGTATVIGDTSRIPEQALSLPGVFRYRTGSREDFIRKTDDALAFAQNEGGREKIARAAGRLLNGEALAQTVHRAFGLA